MSGYFAGIWRLWSETLWGCMLEVHGCRVVTAMRMSSLCKIHILSVGMIFVQQSKVVGPVTEQLLIYSCY